MKIRNAFLKWSPLWVKEGTNINQHNMLIPTPCGTVTNEI